MANFAVSTTDEVISRGRNLIERMMQPGEKQGDVLDRIFKIVEEQADGETMRQEGIDVNALDSALENIRTMFLASAKGRQQIVAEKDSRISEVKTLKDQMEKDLREKLDAAKKEKDDAVAQAEAAAKAAAQAVKDAQAAKEQAETANNLVAEKDRTIGTLADKLSAAEAKINGYDALVGRETAAQEQIRELNRTIEANREDYERQLADAAREQADAAKAAARDLQTEKEASKRALADVEKDHAAEIRELQAQMERKISEAEKDAALSTANAVAQKEREMTELLRGADKENARLQARIELLEERIKAAGSGK